MKGTSSKGRGAIRIVKGEVAPGVAVSCAEAWEHAQVPDYCYALISSLPNPFQVSGLHHYPVLLFPLHIYTNF